jgi:hypothetical protein
MFGQLSTEAQVANFNSTIEGEEDICRLEIPVHYPPLVHMLHRCTDLEFVLVTLVGPILSFA